MSSLICAAVLFAVLLSFLLCLFCPALLQVMQNDAAVFRTQSSLEEGCEKIDETVASFADVKVGRRQQQTSGAHGVAGDERTGGGWDGQLQLAWIRLHTAFMSQPIDAVGSTTW